MGDGDEKAERRFENSRIGSDGRITSDYIPCDKPHRLGRALEFMRIAGADYCLFCLIEAVDSAHDKRPPWFGSPSAHGSEIIALGVPPFRRSPR